MKHRTYSGTSVAIICELVIGVAAVYSLLAVLLMGSLGEPPPGGVADSLAQAAQMESSSPAVLTTEAAGLLPPQPEPSTVAAFSAAASVGMGAPYYPAWYAYPYYYGYSPYSYAYPYWSSYYTRNYRYPTSPAYQPYYGYNPASTKPAPPSPAAVSSASPQVAAAAAPGGDSPSNPANVANSWQSLGPGSSIWVKLGAGGDHIDASLEAYPLSGVTMQVFAPGNLDRPVGQGTIKNSTGQLVWSGGKWNSTGAWIARIANANSAAVSYKLTTSGATIGQCESISYWEKIGTADVYWTRCK